jgi:hypothetical protein
VQQPRVLAGFVQGTLAGLEPAVGARVRARLEPETVRTLERSSRIAWLPIEVDVELTRAIYAELGAGRARELFRRNLSDAFDTPILRSLAQGALRLFGASPVRLFSWAPKAYAQIYRDSGEMRFEAGAPGSARLELTLLPPAIAESRDYLDGVAGSIAAGFDFMDLKGEVTVERFDPPGRRASFRLAWEDEEPLEPLPEPAGA